MSSVIEPPSPLLVLRSNSSRSTLTTDTDYDDTTYASSSAMTTPEDEDQTFQLGQMLRDILDDKDECATPKMDRKGSLTIETKPRNFSLAIKRVKKVARSLVMFKKKRPDDISPILISSPLRERFGKSMTLRAHPDESFYSLPNRRLSVQGVSTREDEQLSQSVSRRFGTISGTSSTLVRSAFRRQKSSGFRLSGFSDVPHGVVLSSKPATPAVERGMVLAHKNNSFNMWNVLLYALRVLLFVPWCAAVGGALLLFPNHLEFVAFRPGYLTSPKGLRRFAHWADCAYQHIMIFFACIFLVLWYNHIAGLSFSSALLSRFVYVWSDFHLDRSIPLGENDQQSLYLVAMDLAFAEDSVVIRGPTGESIVRRVYIKDDI